MLDALGYDIWNPAEVCPEYDADFAVRKLGQKEKVDLAVIVEGLPRIYFEVKPVDTALDGHHGQLARYFNATQTVSLAVLTNGIEYWFFTDTGDANVMDQAPFYKVRLEALDQGLEVLARFHKSVFSAEAIRDYATELNYTAKIVDLLKRELDLRDREPTETFVRWILASEKMYYGRVTSGVVERFCPIVKNALQIVLRDIVRRSVAALDNEVSAPLKNLVIESVEALGQPAGGVIKTDASMTDLDGDTARSRIVTTERELECFALVKAEFESSALAHKLIYDSSTRKEVPIQLAYKDTTGYFVVYLNRPSSWIIRVVIDGRTPWIGFNLSREAGHPLVPMGFRILEPHPYADFRIAVSDPEDIRALRSLLIATLQRAIQDRRGGPTVMTVGNAPI